MAQTTAQAFIGQGVEKELLSYFNKVTQETGYQRYRCYLNYYNYQRYPKHHA